MNSLVLFGCLLALAAMSFGQIVPSYYKCSLVLRHPIDATNVNSFRNMADKNGLQYWPTVSARRNHIHSVLANANLLSYSVSPHLNIFFNATNSVGYIDMTITFEVLWSVATGNHIPAFQALFKQGFDNSPARPAGDSWVYQGLGMALNGFSYFTIAPESYYTVSLISALTQITISQPQFQSPNVKIITLPLPTNLPNYWFFGELEVFDNLGLNTFAVKLVERRAVDFVIQVTRLSSDNSVGWTNNAPVLVYTIQKPRGEYRYRSQGCSVSCGIGSETFRETCIRTQIQEPCLARTILSRTDVCHKPFCPANTVRPRFVSVRLTLTDANDPTGAPAEVTNVNSLQYWQAIFYIRTFLRQLLLNAFQTVGSAKWRQFAIDTNSFNFAFDSVTGNHSCSVTLELNVGDSLENIRRIFSSFRIGGGKWTASNVIVSLTGKSYFSYAPKQLFSTVIGAHADPTAPLTFTIALPSSLYDGSQTYAWTFGNIQVQGDPSLNEMFTVTAAATQPDPTSFVVLISKVGGGAWTQTPTLIYEVVDVRGTYTNWVSQGCSVTCGHGLEEFTRSCTRAANQAPCLGVLYTKKREGCRRLPCPKYKPALMCYECRSDRSNEDCIRGGRLTKCQANQGSCENTVRVNHGRLEIIKGCKQTQACNNNMLQNKLSSSSGRTQCNFGAYETVCRCCCTSSKCNSRPLYCAHADLQLIGNGVQGTGKEYTIANLLRSPRRRYSYPNRQRHMRTNPNYFNTQQQQQRQQQQQQRRTHRNWWGTRYAAHPCRHNPCSNGGTCVRGFGSRYTCRCPAGWMDSHCNTPISLNRSARRTYWFG